MGAGWLRGGVCWSEETRNNCQYTVNGRRKQREQAVAHYLYCACAFAGVTWQWASCRRTWPPRSGAVPWFLLPHHTAVVVPVSVVVPVLVPVLEPVIAGA